ncbi:hypothetical protein, partial [Aeromonas hydrophila]|uniref:hypothetical protein n=1 Tax=Aeromonas hydrophila TaxID=644 RepID=UPI003EC6E3A6
RSFVVSVFVTAGSDLGTGIEFIFYAVFYPEFRLLTSLEPNDGLTVHGKKDGDGKPAFQACGLARSTGRERSGGKWHQKKQGRVLPPGPVV